MRRDFEENKQVCLNERGVFYKELSPLDLSNRERIIEFCRLLNLDFGSIDTITDNEGSFYILDVNKTPWERGIPEHFLDIFRQRLVKLDNGDKND